MESWHTSETTTDSDRYRVELFAGQSRGIEEEFCHGRSYSCDLPHDWPVCDHGPHRPEDWEQAFTIRTVVDRAGWCVMDRRLLSLVFRYGLHPLPASSHGCSDLWKLGCPGRELYCWSSVEASSDSKMEASSPFNCIGDLRIQGPPHSGLGFDAFM
jgi:hypothetical protein